MKRKGKIFLVALAAMLGAALLIHFSISGRKKIPDRVVQGKLISVWAKEALATDQYYQYTELFKAYGADVTPYLVPALETMDSSLNATWVKCWAKLPKRMQGWFEPPMLAKERRMHAVVLLREMGPPGKDAVPALTERLSDSDGTISLHSAIALGGIGPAASNAVPALLPFLKDKSYTVRVYTANAIWGITRRPEPSLSVLEKELQDRNASYRWATASFLGEMGAAAKPAIPILEETVTNSSKDVRSVCIQSLAEISPETTPFLTNLLASPDPAIRISACVALGKIGPAASNAVPMLTPLLNDRAQGAPLIMGRSTRPEEVRVSATEALRRIQQPTNATQENSGDPAAGEFQ
jgi:hypothetical protein